MCGGGRCPLLSNVDRYLYDELLLSTPKITAMVASSTMGVLSSCESTCFLKVAVFGRGREFRVFASGVVIYTASYGIQRRSDAICTVS